MAEARMPPKVPAAIAAAVLLSVPVTAAYEGLRTKPYSDPAGIKTVCYGETERAMRMIYTADECKVLLAARQQQDYAPAVLKCVPGLAQKREAFAASIDAAYNAGTVAFCRSRMAQAFNAGRWKEGCDGFSGWYVTAKGKKLPGLVKRREAERQLCLSGLS